MHRVGDRRFRVLFRNALDVPVGAFQRRIARDHVGHGVIFLVRHFVALDDVIVVRRDDAVAQETLEPLLQGLLPRPVRLEHFEQPAEHRDTGGRDDVADDCYDDLVQQFVSPSFRGTLS